MIVQSQGRVLQVPRRKRDFSGLAYVAVGVYQGRPARYMASCMALVCAECADHKTETKLVVQSLN